MDEQSLRGVWGERIMIVLNIICATSDPRGKIGGDDGTGEGTMRVPTPSFLGPWKSEWGTAKGGEEKLLSRMWRSIENMLKGEAQVNSMALAWRVRGG